jgi:hypothetical protein
MKFVENVKSIFKTKEEDLEFIDTTRSVYTNYPPVLAKTIQPLKDRQIEEKKEYTFPGCPGMFDYSTMGYLIPAWSNFHIKANKAGSVAVLGSLGEDNMKRNTDLPKPVMRTDSHAIPTPRNMDPEITSSLFEYQDGLKPAVWSFPGVWKIDGKRNVSALIMPAIYHSNFLDNVFVYPGVVDYNGFYTINFVFSVKRKCEFVIKAGDPILQVIPFITTKEIISSYGPGTTEQHDKFRIVKWFNESNFYRRFFMVRKKYKIYKKVH